MDQQHLSLQFCNLWNPNLLLSLIIYSYSPKYRCFASFYLTEVQCKNISGLKPLLWREVFTCIFEWANTNHKLLNNFACLPFREGCQNCSRTCAIFRRFNSFYSKSTSYTRLEITSCWHLSYWNHIHQINTLRSILKEWMQNRSPMAALNRRKAVSLWAHLLLLTRHWCRPHSQPLRSPWSSLGPHSSMHDRVYQSLYRKSLFLLSLQSHASDSLFFPWSGFLISYQILHMTEQWRSVEKVVM